MNSTLYLIYVDRLFSFWCPCRGISYLISSIHFWACTTFLRDWTHNYYITNFMNQCFNPLVYYIVPILWYPWIIREIWCLYSVLLYLIFGYFGHCWISVAFWNIKPCTQYALPISYISHLQTLITILSWSLIFDPKALGRDSLYCKIWDLVKEGEIAY